MARSLVAILTILLSFAILPQLLFANAYAKWPMYNSDHTLGQFMQLLIVPMGIAIVVLGVWAIRARQPQIITKIDPLAMNESTYFL